MIDSLIFFSAAAQKHLVPKVSETLTSRSSPITQVCQSLSRLHNAERSYTKNNQDCMVASTGGSDSDVKLVKVKQAWTASPEAATSIEVVRRRKKSEPGSTTTEAARNLNVINNNNNGSSEAADLNLKRRSYHPQDYLSQVLDPGHSDLTGVAASSRLKRKDFPKVQKSFLYKISSEFRC